MSFVSGTLYVIRYGNDSTSCCRNITTKPMSVKSLLVSDVTPYSVSVTWSKPDEYKTSYSYRVQTNVTSSATMINNTIVASESATIMNLTPGETYTFMVYTRAADNTESDPVSYTTCTVPGQVSSISLNNYKSVDVVGATWTGPAGKVDNYTVRIVSLTGAINNIIQSSSTQVNFTGLLPGREYNVTVQTVSGSCNRTSSPVTEATYPTPPRSLTINTIGTNILTLSWVEPVNMSDVNKSYNITYRNSSDTWTVTSNTTNVVLQSLTSGTNYTITVVTGGVRGYPSSPVSTSVYTKPMSVKSVQVSNSTTNSVSVTWSKPDEYKTSYSYRVQTNVTSSATMINNTIVASESATIMNLISGETYTFMVYTRAADNITESDPVLNTTCTVPGQVSSISLNNYKLVDVVGATWTGPAGKVDNYTVRIVSLTGAINNIIYINATQVNFTGLLPGREYNVTVQTVSGSCSRTSSPVTEATYPTQPRSLTINAIGTNILTLSWVEPVNMSDVNKSYNITYRNSSDTWTVTSNTTNVVLQSLISGTNYTITVVTGGVWGYPSSPVSTSVYTKPMSVKSLQVSNSTTNSVSVTWSKPDEYKTSYSYRVQTNVTSSATTINNTIVASESATIMNLTPGETYTFMVYTRAADHITESDPVSYTTCTVPGQVSSISLNNYKSVDVVGATWTGPAGKVDNYTVRVVSLTGAINNIIYINATQVNFTGLLPGREYNVTVQTVSGSCSRTSSPVTEATYPTQPRNLTINTIGTNILTLSWVEPVNMSDVNKSYNITYRNSSDTWTVTSNTTNVTLQSLISGTNYTITVVTVGVRGYPSSPVSRSVYTKPMSVKSLQVSNSTTNSVSVTWSKPDEYKTSYSYRVQTNVTSSATTINNTIVASESATIMNLISGETYTFMVYTRAADNITESDPVLNTTCTVPGQVSSISLNNYKSVDVVGATWTGPAGKVDNYTVRIVSLTGAINNIIYINATQVNFTGLLPGREYNVTVQTVSGSCSQTSSPVTEATYPTQPRSLTINTIGTNILTFSWVEPVNMSDVNKSYNITYRNSSDTWTVTSNTTNVVLQSLTSGTNYTITVVTVGVRGYPSSPVSTSVYTKPMSVKSLQVSNSTTNSVPLTWSKPDEYKTSYSYRVQTNVTSSATMINNTIVASESATIMNLTPGETYTFMVYTRAADNTESEPVLNTTCTVPGQVSSISLNNYKSVDVVGATWTGPAGKVDNYTVRIVSLTGAINNIIYINATQVNFTGLLPGREYNVTVQTVSGSCSRTSSPVTEATYPTQPRSLTINTIGTNILTLSWVEPVNMSDVNKSYNITYRNSSDTWTVTSNTTNVVLRSLISGTNYTITVVTVGVRGYPSSPVSTSVYTKPMSVKSLQISNSTTYSVSVTWSKPDEYKTSYSYRVQTNVTSSATMINNTIVTSESATIMNLTPGETYTFMVYTRAADNTESDPVLNTTCTVPGQVSSISLNNYKSVDVVGATWTGPAGKVDNYTVRVVSLTGAINNIIYINATQVNFTGLLPGREYNVTVQTVSGSCSQTSSPVTEATYPTQPRSLTINTIGTNILTLSWVEPVNMSDVNKSYNITYRNSSDTWTVTSNTTNVVLQSLTSGTNYTITVVTVGVRGYPSSPVSTSVYTKPMSVKSLQVSNSTTNSVSLTWSKPDEYKTSYSYRVQTNVTSSATMINNTIVTSESATIMNLTPGETYTFMVYTRAADNITESDPVSYTTCTLPEKVVNITMTNYNSADILGVMWMRPAGQVEYYTVRLTGAINNIIQSSSTQVNFTGLLPGREYNVTVQTVSGSCSRTSSPVTEATCPTPLRNVIFNTIETNILTLSWVEPVNMSDVNKSYNITYRNSSDAWTVTSNTINVVLRSLTSGTNYTITVVTVGVRGYQSSPVSTSVYTKPMTVKSLLVSDVTPYSVSVTWSKPDEYKTSYIYRVQTNVTSSATTINNTIVTSESATIMNLTPGETYTFMVYTRADDHITESDLVSYTTCTVPEAAHELNCSAQENSASLYFTWYCPVGLYTGFTFVATNNNNASVRSVFNTTKCSPDPQKQVMEGLQYYTIYTVNMTTQSTCGKSSNVVQKQCSTKIGPPPDPIGPVIETISPPSYNYFDFTFYEFDASNGPIKAYAVIVSNINGTKPSANDLIKTYSDFKSKTTNAYVSNIIYSEGKTSQRSGRAGTKSVRIGDDSVSSPYRNQPLEPLSTYWVSIAGFTSLARDETGRILPKESIFSFAPFNGPINTIENIAMIIGAVVGSILGVLVIALVGFFIWKLRRKGEKKSDVPLPPRIPPAMSTASFISHFAKQKADSNLGFSEEYEKLVPVGIRQSKLASEKLENKEKNRYTNVLPYDATRVKLSSLGNLTEDYINANYIPGYSFPQEFIAAQGPLPRTVDDFWRMIWEKDVQAIVMLTKCVELGKVKCEEYWPQRSAKIYGNLSISMIDENILPDWATRDFTLVNMQTKQSKQVRHFHFTAWPDHGVPRTTSDLIKFRNLVREYAANCYPLNSPILVHCSAGVGRTGTLIALDRIIKQIETEDRIDVYGVIYDLRMHRILMVQTEHQYIFLNQCALDIIKAKKETNPDLIYQNTSAIYENINNTSVKRTNF
ncbi:receptor-type tyrosine-protein phosphatase beta-like [Rhinoderma darwinii]|uniref:receptor-type tyrosine-protein phosphatase beta-like n=1 Tax=Rhinoderma darwinii TaxID=43563 RepID=UPI003F67D019